MTIIYFLRGLFRISTMAVAAAAFLVIGVVFGLAMFIYDLGRDWGRE